MNMDKARILIVEDELITAMTMQTTLEKAGYEVTGIAAAGEEALQLVSLQLPDMILMDIHLSGGGLNGIQISMQLGTAYDIPVIYVTRETGDKYFQSAIRTSPINYIPKPFTDAELLRAVAMAAQYTRRAQTRTEEERFIYNQGTEQQKILLRDVVYLEASGAYTNLYLLPWQLVKEKKTLRCMKISRSSNHVAAQLRCPGLTQVHRSYYVHIAKIERYDARHVYIGDISIPVSRSFRKALQDRLNELRGGT